MYHPNVDESSGSICLDVINQTWSPMFDLINIFDVFLPQLLLYPNPADPLNGEAAKLLQKDPERYNRKIKEYVKKYASENITLKTDKSTSNNNANNNSIKNNNPNKEEEKNNNEETENNKEEIKSEASSELSKASIDENDLDDDE